MSMEVRRGRPEPGKESALGRARARERAARSPHLLPGRAGAALPENSRGRKGAERGRERARRSRGSSSSSPDPAGWARSGSGGAPCGGRDGALRRPAPAPPAAPAAADDLDQQHEQRVQQPGGGRVGGVLLHRAHLLLQEAAGQEPRRPTSECRAPGRRGGCAARGSCCRPGRAGPAPSGWAPSGWALSGSASTCPPPPPPRGRTRGAARAAGRSGEEAAGKGFPRQASSGAPVPPGVAEGAPPAWPSRSRAEGPPLPGGQGCEQKSLFVRWVTALSAPLPPLPPCSFGARSEVNDSLFSWFVGSERPSEVFKWLGLSVQASGALRWRTN